MATLSLNSLSSNNFFLVSFTLISFTLIQYFIQYHFKKTTDKHIEIYKVITGGNLDRRKKFIEKEYLATSECWLSFTKAYMSIKNSLFSFYRSYFFDDIEEDDLELILSVFDFSKVQIHTMKRTAKKINHTSSVKFAGKMRSMNQEN